jgi:predicted dithiol-disulfide oxidoreductase (DUF899 family)
MSDHKPSGQPAMGTPPVVSPEAWEAARQQMLVKEKALTRARDALAAERRRMPWMAVEKAYEFAGPNGKLTLLDLFEGRRQLIVYRAFFEPGVFGWPEHACRGCSLGADQVAHLAHLNARDTTLAYVSRAPVADIARLKARMGWAMPWYSITDSFDADFGVDEWHGHNVFFRDGGAGVPHLLHQQPRRRGDGDHLELSRHHPARPPGGLGGLARGLSSDAAVQVVELARQLCRRSRAPPEVGRGVRRRGGRVPEQGRRRHDMTGIRTRAVIAPPGARLDGEHTAAAAAGLANWLCMAATPTFAIMALLTGLDGSPLARLCSARSGAPLSGMAPMYLFMSAFHSPPWLRLIFAQRGAAGRS